MTGFGVPELLIILGVLCCLVTLAVGVVIVIVVVIRNQKR